MHATTPSWIGQARLPRRSTKSLVMPSCPAPNRCIDSRSARPPLAALRNRAAPPAVCPRLGESGEVRRLKLLDLKTTPGDESRNVPRQVAAREHPVEYRLQALLPPSHWRIWRTAMLEKDKPAPWSQDTFDASYSLND